MLMSTVPAGETAGFRFDPHREFIANTPHMVSRAREAAHEKGVSPRGFLVGAAVMAIIEETHEMRIIEAANSKRKHKTKVCAEHRALGLARKQGLRLATGIVVVGPSDPEQVGSVTDIITPTLHPCRECQNRFLEDELMRKDTLILTSGLERDIYQIHTADEIWNHHDDQNHSRIDEPVMHGFDKWDRRVEAYDTLVQAEQTLPIAERRPRWKIAKMALTV